MARRILKVTTLADSGKGSLRNAIDKANRCRYDIIIFEVTGTIILLSPLPQIMVPLLLNGGDNQTPVVEINFNGNSGLVFFPGSDNSIIQGLALTNSSDNGIAIYSNNVGVYRNFIGVNLAGIAAGNANDGIFISNGSMGVIIGSNPNNVSGLASNVISNNGINGIEINNASNVTIVANFIGTDPSGTIAMPNRLDGIYLTNTQRNIIGGTVYTNSEGITNNPTGSKGTVPIVYIFPPLGNLVSGNTRSGIALNNANNNTLYGNFVGVDVSGIVALGNGFDGVHFFASNSNSMIGCNITQNPFVYYNVCSGNAANGIHVTNSDNVTIQGNFGGIGADNATMVPNGANGLLIDGTSVNTTVGGVIPLGNVFSGNTLNGIAVVDTVSNFITFNTFGGIFAFVGAAPNGLNGLYISSTGGNNTVRTNVFSGNINNGIHLDGAIGVIIEEIIAGLNTIGNAPIANGGDGLLISADANGNFIGRNVASIIPRNTFSGNLGNGIRITDTAHNNLITMSFVGFDVTGRFNCGNILNGVLIELNAHDNYVGTALFPPAIYTNYIGFNGNYGVLLQNAATNNIIANNHIDLNVLEQAAPNGSGPLLDTSSGTNIFINNIT